MIVELRLSCFLFYLSTVNSEIYLYKTNDAPSIEYYDCVLVQSSLLYCRRPKEPINLTRDNQSTKCELNGGRLHRFSELRSKNISVSTVLHRWKSSLERVEDYSRYLRDSSQSDGDLCQCLHPGSFGKNCEYRLPSGETFEEILDWQLIMRDENPLKVQIYGDIVCYETLQCNSGVLCLDWREICDGIQHCLEGRDEENCDLLEMNLCHPDEEYRCMNGMCIPDGFFLDGDLDCLDWSDEMQFKADWNCPFESVSRECDDHLCLFGQWSCGDGQCIRDRLDFQEGASQTCKSGRDQYFMCEMHVEEGQWTMSNGRCVDGNRRYEDSSAANRSEEEQCEFLLKCSLSQGAEKRCPYGRGLEEVCPSPLIRYPNRSIVAPFLFFLFNRTRNWTSKLPDFYLINGTVRCGNSLITVIDEIIPFERDLNPREILEDYFCQTPRSIFRSENDQFREEWCHRANESIDRCGEWNSCMSITRIKDGFEHCLNRRDENGLTAMEIEESCSRVQRHRFRCSSEQVTCFSVMKIRDERSNCENSFDEIWFGIGQWLTSMVCNDALRHDCSLLRQYIDQSWRSTSTNKTVKSSPNRISFRSYCNTFWDLSGREDEHLLECQRSWVCPEGQHQCENGQCIESRWREDHEWDCADASDEHYQLNSNTRQVLETASGHDFTNQSYLVPAACSQSLSFLCLSSEATRQGFECFNLSQIGDLNIDCAGGFDERNTLRHCSQSSSMLGSNFLCRSTNTCIPYVLHCLNGNRCPNRFDDDHWCGREDQSLNSSDLNDFTCFDGQRVQSSRCDNYLDCLFGEDEYMCDYFDSLRTKISREQKQSSLRIKQHIVRWSRYPRDANITQMDSTSFSIDQSRQGLLSNLSSLSVYWCNRGLGVLSTNDSTIVCFCPPQYYGEKCQFHADRLSVVLRVNVSQSTSSSTSDSRILLKLIVVFLINEEVFERDQFHLHPSAESPTPKIHMHFVYPHSSSSREQRRRRFINRSDLLDRHPYSIRIELYQSRLNERATLIALWKYSIIFDHLPGFRLAQMLHFSSSSTERNPCSSNPCRLDERCQPLMNNRSQFVCLCKTNFQEENCSRKDPQCDKGYCAVGSLCQSSARGSIRGDLSLPFCLCPFNRYGDRCSIEHDACFSSPCRNGGSCLPDSQPNQVICLCREEYFGSQCELKRRSIRLSLSINRSYRGAVIQFLQIDLISLHLNLVDQQVFRTLPQLIEYFHSDHQTTFPDIVLAKVYSSDEDLSPDIYLLSVHLIRTLPFFSFNGRTQISSINQCEHIRTFSNGNRHFCADILRNHSIVCSLPEL